MPFLLTMFATKVLLLYAAVMFAAAASLAWKPQIGIYTAVFLLPLQTTRYHLHGLPLGASIIDVLLFSSIIGFFLHSKQQLLRPSKLNKLMLAIGVFYGLSVLRGTLFLGDSVQLESVSTRLSDYKNFLVMPFIFFAVAGILRTRKDLKILICVLCISCAAVDWGYYKSTADRSFAHFSPVLRDAGPLGYAGENGLAAYLVEFSVFLVAFAATKGSLGAKMLGGLLLAANTYCILFTFSRGAYLALALVLLYLAVVRVRWLLVPILVLAIGWQSFLPTSVKERMAMTYDQSGGELDGSAQEHLALWNDSMNLFKQNPIIGSGFFTYEYMGRVGPYRDTHNYYMKLLVETGVVGLLFFFAQLILFWWCGLRLFRTAKDSFLSSLGLGYSGLVICAAIVNVFGDRFLFLQVNCNLWVVLGCVVSAQQLIHEETVEKNAFPTLVPAIDTDEWVPLPKPTDSWAQ